MICFKKSLTWFFIFQVCRNCRCAIQNRGTCVCSKSYKIALGFFMRITQDHFFDKHICNTRATCYEMGGSDYHDIHTSLR